MTDAKGLRVHNEHSLHVTEDPSKCPNFVHARWRTLECDNQTDVVECSRCGQQRMTSCNFDEEYN